MDIPKSIINELTSGDEVFEPKKTIDDLSATSAEICTQSISENIELGQLTTCNNTTAITNPEDSEKPLMISPEEKNTEKILVDIDPPIKIEQNGSFENEPKPQAEQLVNIDKGSVPDVDPNQTTTTGKKTDVSPPTNNKRKSDYQIESNIDEKKIHNMRKNIRGVINENNFDTITINAQREESERLARVQGLKKLVKQKYLHSALESMVEGVHEVEDDRFLASCEPIEPQPQHIKKINFDLKDKIQRLEEKKSDKKIWNQWFSAESKESASSEKVEEVVTIESSSDEDDCIILSDSDDCLDDEADDHHNSGLHVRDVLNIPNEHGKVMVNVGHVDSEPDIFLAPQIAKVIKPHQIGGVRFLFDNIIESTKRFNNSSGFGCILAHSMGLGKTLQVVSFSDIFLRHTDSKTILCVMPINTIQNWVKEYNLWLPEESQNHEEVRPRNFKVFALNDQHKTMSSRSKVIARWHAEGGVLLMGYELFRVLGLKIIKRKDGKKSLENSEHKRLLDNMHAALVKPGPDLVICDEGHRIKNAHAGISIALKQIRSRRRIVLTGYPLQNNLLEYWCMVDFVRPNYLGSKTEFCNMFERPIQNGQCIDSTPEDIKLMRYRAHVLHSLLVGFVQRRSDSVLQNSLPQKFEYVILTKMTKFQRKLYDAFMNEVVRKKKVPNPLKAFAVCCKIWNHPDVLYNFLKKRESDLDLDIDEPETTLKTTVGKPKVINKNAMEFTPSPSISRNDDFLLGNTGLQENIGLYPSEKNLNDNLWQDTDGSSAGGQQYQLNQPPLLAEDLKCSSEIVDLDTKQVQLVQSDFIGDTMEVGNMNSTTNFEQNKTSPNKPQPGGGGINNNNLNIINKTVVKMETKSGNDTISYDWAISLIKDYEPGVLSTSPKMQIFFYILEESIKLGDRVLVFSQSLLTLNVMEVFLQGLTIPETEKHWKKNVSYFRLDGSTGSMEREKLVNDFNSNTDVKLFLISTRAGSLGINLTGANRVVVFDASWNPCHDTQAVHRIYRYGQGKQCYVYRIVMDNCLEKNIYDRQVKKQGMSDRVVDECNPDAHLSIRELTNLCYDKVEDDECTEFKQPIENYSDEVMRSMLTKYKAILSKEPFYHESLLIDRKEKKLSQTEKKLAKRGYEIEKKASTKPHHFIHNIHNIVQRRDCMINKVNTQVLKNRINQPFKNAPMKLTRWIPAEVWQRQGMSSQEMKLPIDVAIPTNSNDSSNIVVKAGEKVMVLNSPKGVYMQLESGKIIAIKTSADATKDKLLKMKKLPNSQITDKNSLPTLDALAFKEGSCRAAADDAGEGSENDDCIVINDSINDSSENSFDMPYTSTKKRFETTTIKKQVVPQIPTKTISSFPQIPTKTMSSVVKEDRRVKPTPIKQHHPFRQDKPPDAITQKHSFRQDKIDSTKIIQNHEHRQEKPAPRIPNHQFLQNKPEIPTQNHHHINRQEPEPERMIQNNPMPIRQDNNLPDPLLLNHQNFEPKPNLEHHPPPTNYPEKQCNYLYGKPSNHSEYDMIVPQNIESQHFPTLTTPQQQRWKTKSPDLFKQAFKISNIPAPYPSTAICDLNGFAKNDKPQQPIDDSINGEQYNPQSYTSNCKEAEDPVYHHNLNYNLSYQHNNPHPVVAPPPQHPQQPQQSLQLPLPPPENNGSLNSLYHYNNKHENAYSENMYENSDASHSNYHHHHQQQLSKYSYGYYNPPYLPPSYPDNSNSNKLYDNSAFPPVSSQYYMHRPSTYSSSSTNGIDVGYNYAEPQEWMKKNLPE